MRAEETAKREFLSAKESEDFINKILKVHYAET